MPPQLCPQPFLIPIFNFSHKWPTFAFTDENGYTLGSRRKIAHKGTHGETGGISDGGGITTLGAFRTFTNIPGPGVRTANFAAFGSWPGVRQKDAESLRDSDALMRVAVPRRRGPAGLRNSTCLYGCKRQRNYQANINITPADKIDTAEGVYKTRPFSQYRQLRVIINLCRGGIMYREFIL